jgi:hypothetical protein
MLVGHELDAKLKAIGATIRDDVLELPARDGVPARQLRVSDGIVFARESADGRWRELDWRAAPPERLLAYFTENSAVATWLRVSGVDLLQLALVSLAR